MSDDTQRRSRMIDLWTDPGAGPAERRAFLEHADPALWAEAEALDALWTDLGEVLDGPPSSQAAATRALAAARRALAPSRGPRWLYAAAVAVLAFGAGWAGRSWRAGTPPAPDPRPEFLLVIRGNVPEGSEPEVANAMRTWAVELEERAHLLDARQLDERSVAWVGVDPGPARRGPVVGGYFLLRATDREEAVELAGGAPHLAYGGDTAVEVLPLLR